MLVAKAAILPCKTLCETGVTAMAGRLSTTLTGISIVVIDAKRDHIFVATQKCGAE